MADRNVQTVFLKDYQPPAYLVEKIELIFQLGEDVTIVKSRLDLRRNPDGRGGPLVLDGRDLTLRGLHLDRRSLTPDEYEVTDETLVLFTVPERFQLVIETEIKPQENTSLEGLYTSSGNFCTQCEAQGFRKITYYPDRPDVMAPFTVSIIADKSRYPVLLSNGNLVTSIDLPDGRHLNKWEDPFRKPAYLFALVAGDLVRIEDTFVTKSGREVKLHIYVQERNSDQCDHAMASLKKAMTWDEEVFGLEYDLDIYMIVAVDDFNMGAMENKGLNIFNSRYVLARPETATDADFQAIEGVIGHEYFHNWTGNRVTCRDWFQLSLKEGLTVFRDQEFSADMTSRAVKRIEEVRLLRNVQFPEDSGPMAHPVRPESYQEINNFYTATVYNKGAEVIRLYQTLFGREGFRKGLRLYLERHDGRAATVEDFLQAMADANRADLSHFSLWYGQAGTPRVQAATRYDSRTGDLELTLRQDIPATPGQASKEPMLIPIAVGLLGSDGEDLPLQLAGDGPPAEKTTRVLQLSEAEQTFRFVNVPERPVLSLLRDFSAPVRLEIEEDDTDLAFRMAHDGDSFNRWEAAQELARRVLLRMVDQRHKGEETILDTLLIDAFGRALVDPDADPALLAQVLNLPGEIDLAEQMDQIDPEGIHQTRRFARHRLATVLRGDLAARYRSLQEDGPYSIDPAAVGRRSLKNLCLGYLLLLEEDEVAELCLDQFRRRDNMTDVLAALAALAHSERPERLAALEDFYQRWQHDPLVVDKWFALQATAPGPETLARVKELLEHPAFVLKNPNKVRALVGSFCHGNPARFHAEDGSGYAFAAAQVLAIDGFNPQVAARLATCLSRWRRYEPRRGELMKGQLERIAARKGVSRDVGEIVGKSLGYRIGKAEEKP